MVDLTQRTVKKIFYEQVRALTLKGMDSFDYQFSDACLEAER
jgi:hypothetical protein